MKKSKLLLLLLIIPTSCVNFKPYVFSEAYLNPSSLTEVNYENLNFSYALFNQYASGISYKFRINFSTYHPDIDFTLGQLLNGSLTFFNNWTTKTATYIEGVPDATYTSRLNTILFGRQFNRTTKKADTNDFVIIRRRAAAQSLNYEIIMESRISYSVNIGSVYQAFVNNPGSGFEQYYKYIKFYDANDVLLQSVLLDQDASNVQRNSLYNLSTIITGVRKFSLTYQWVDIPPFGTITPDLNIYEFNIFTQNQEIYIPDNADGDLFGFEFVAVEWWNFLGHAQNFLWWVINKSPISPVFVWIDTYIITWFEGFFNFMEELFNL